MSTLSQEDMDAFAFLYGRTERFPESLKDLVAMRGGKIVGPATFRLVTTDEGKTALEGWVLPAAITVKDAAAALTVSQSTVRRLIKEGALEGCRFAGATRVHWDSLMRMMNR